MAPIRMGADTLTVQTTFPSPAGIFNSVVTTGNGTPPNNSSLIDNTYLNRNGGDTYLGNYNIQTSGQGLNVSASACNNLSCGHTAVGFPVSGAPVPAARLDVYGVIRAYDTGGGPLPLSPPAGNGNAGNGMELYAYGNTGYINVRNEATNAAGTLYLFAAGQGGILNIQATQVTMQSLSTNPNTNMDWITVSDGRLKNVLGRYAHGLKEILALEPIRYAFKPNNPLHIPPGGEQIGVVAQELRKNIPEAVNTASNGYLAVNDSTVLWTMVNAIQEQQKEIEDLKARLDSLRPSRASDAKTGAH